MKNIPMRHSNLANRTFSITLFPFYFERPISTFDRASLQFIAIEIQTRLPSITTAQD